MPNLDLIDHEAPFFSSQVLSPRRFFRPVISDPTIPLHVIAGGRESCSPGYLVDRIDFPYYAVEFVTSGRGILSLPHREHELLPGTLFLYGPGIPHTIRNTGSDPLIKYFATFYGVRGSLPVFRMV